MSNVFCADASLSVVDCNELISVSHLGVSMLEKERGKTGWVIHLKGAMEH